MPLAPFFELDHLFICTDVNAPAAQSLASIGLQEGPSNVHPGQGTANRRFFFHNAMLELLWVHSREEATSDSIRRTQLWKRWQQRASSHTCPFAFCLRPTSSIATSSIEKSSIEKSDVETDNPLLFESWDFCPPYLPEPLSISIATNSSILAEPMLFQTPFSMRPDQKPPEKRPPLNHPLGLREITSVAFTVPTDFVHSVELQSVLQKTDIQCRTGEPYGVELGFDHQHRGQSVDLRPELPLVLRW